LRWVGEKRTKESFQKFFDLIGKALAGKIEFVCADMWKSYLDLIKQNCTGALNILDRFHVVVKLNKAIDEIRAAEARQLVKYGFEPKLKKLRWCLLKRPQNPTDHQRIKLKDVLRYNLKSVRAYLFKEYFQLGRLDAVSDADQALFELKWAKQHQAQAHPAGCQDVRMSGCQDIRISRSRPLL